MIGSDLPHTTYRLFVSYAREDAREIALRLRDDLNQAGHNTWLDTSEIAAGASWSRDIEKAIETCDLMIALLTPGSYVSDMCRSEQMRALRNGALEAVEGGRPTCPLCGELIDPEGHLCPRQNGHGNKPEFSV